MLELSFAQRSKVSVTLMIIIHSDLTEKYSINIIMDNREERKHSFLVFLDDRERDKKKNRQASESLHWLMNSMLTIAGDRPGSAAKAKNSVQVSHLSE